MDKKDFLSEVSKIIKMKNNFNYFVNNDNYNIKDIEYR